MNKSILALLLPVFAAACVTTSPVVPMGKDSYMITGSNAGGLNRGKGKTLAVQQANAHCASLKKFLVVRRFDSEAGVFDGTQSTTLVFSCVAEDDPEYTRPNLTKDPSVVIEDQRK